VKSGQGAGTEPDGDGSGGRLVLAATPLGAAVDASERLMAELSSADMIAAEDTRRLRALAAKLGVTVSGKVVSFYESVERSRVPGLVEAVASGRTVLLVTDAGMPSVSDPGYLLVSACVDADLPVTCVPGPSAVTTALAVSGLPSDRFCFEGFAPRKQGERRAWLRNLAAERRTCVFFESPQRLADTLADAASVLGDRRAAVCRELTKPYEEIRRGTLTELTGWAREGVRGEVTIVLDGASAREAPDVATLVPDVETRAASGERLKDAVAAVATASGVSKRALYESVLSARRAK
jgi:16S rRNA (cytidine1402-2'-O)-methyltransferase